MISKTLVDPCPNNGHSVGWTVMTETIVLGWISFFYRYILHSTFTVD